MGIQPSDFCKPSRKHETDIIVSDFSGVQMPKQPINRVSDGNQPKIYNFTPQYLNRSSSALPPISVSDMSMRKSQVYETHTSQTSEQKRTVKLSPIPDNCEGNFDDAICCQMYDQPVQQRDLINGTVKSDIICQNMLRVYQNNRATL